MSATNQFRFITFLYLEKIQRLRGTSVCPNKLTSKMYAYSLMETVWGTSH